MENQSELKKTLGPVMLWGLGVGYVISGMYFGWNLGLPEGGPLGLLVALVIVTIMYVTFVLSYSELACAIPKAGGAFVYANRAFGPNIGFLGGMAQIVEFVFAPPAIAVAIGAYMNIFFPDVSPTLIAFIAYIIFTAINIWGVRVSAIFELVITVLAVIELLIFAGVAAPEFSIEAFSRNPLPNGWMGVFPAIPYAIWFYLAIEGVANVAEESRDPQKDIPKGFGSAMFTLVVLAILTFFFSVGVDGWESVVYKMNVEGTGFILDEGGNPLMHDSPLPLALSKVVGGGHILYHLLVLIGLFGLVASFHGIILIAGRATFEFGRIGYFPKILGRTHARFKTPAAALVANMVVGFGAILTAKTGEIITLAVFGALTLYCVSLFSLFKLRASEADLERPYKTPWYPILPGVSLLLALVCLGALFYYNFQLALIYMGILLLAYLWFWFVLSDEVRSHRFGRGGY